jgi:hypothetical protein
MFLGLQRVLIKQTIFPQASTGTPYYFHTELSLNCRMLSSTPPSHSPATANMPPNTSNNPTPPPAPYSQPVLTTIPGPQLTTRYGPQPASSSPASSTPVLTTIQGPQLTTRYTLPGIPGSNVRPPIPPPLPRTPSQPVYHTTTASPLSMPSGPPAAMSQVSTQSTSALVLPTSGNVPGSAAAATAALSRGGGRKPMSLRGAFSKERTLQGAEDSPLASRILTDHNSVHALMYACGDDSNPASDTVNVMEEILIEYIEQLVNIQ